MKYIWEESDIVCGKIVNKPREKHEHPSGIDGWDAKWTFKIGYTPIDDSKTQYALICLADGMVSPVRKTKKEIVKFLNENEMIPSSHKYIISLMNYLRDVY